MLKAYEFRIYPSNKQKELLAKHFGCARFVFNMALNRSIEHYHQTGKFLPTFENNNYFTQLKKEESYAWLKDIQSSVITNALFNLNTAFNKFFKEKAGFPKFKSKHDHRYSFTMHQSSGVCKLDYENNKIWVPKIKWLDCRLSRMVEGVIKSVTIKQVPSSKYFISVLVEDGSELPNKLPITEETTIGIDLGLKTFAVLSNGSEYPRMRIIKQEEKQLAKLQKRLSRKVKGSKNREKARIKVARQQEKIANIRKDFLHKTSTSIVNENQVNTICLETLNISGMMKNHKVAKGFADVSLCTFKQMLEYKTDRLGKNILYIGRFEPSSQLCHVCGFKNPEVKNLEVRVWVCPQCGTTHDRDINAAINIKNIALSEHNLKYSGQGLSVELVESLALVRTVKQERLNIN